MNLKIFQSRSLKTRVTLFTLVIFVAGIWSLTLYASRMLREDMQRLLGEQQLSTVSFIATSVNDELNERISVLEAIAGLVDPAMLADTARLQAFLEERLILSQEFNGGAFATGIAGTTIASIPLSARRLGINYMERDHVAAALKQGRSTVSTLTIGKALQAPVFGVGAPIRDAKGKVIGAMVGVTDLSKPNFLDKIAGNSYGKTGGYLLVAPKQRLIVTATDKRRIMEALPAPGISPAVDRFLDGAEGSELFVNASGTEVLASAKRLPAAGWQVAALLPTEEAFAPIRAMQQRMLSAAALLTLIAALLTWWMLRRQFSTMLTAASALSALSATGQLPQPLPITRQDEVGDLIGGFNRLLEVVRQREIALRESEERFRALSGMSSDFYWETDAEHRLTQRTETVREASESVFRDAPSVGKRRWEIPYLAPDESGWEKHRATLNGHLPFRDFEILRIRANGARHYISISGDPVFNASGDFTGYRGIGKDITERKQQEEQTRQLLVENETILNNAMVGIAYLKQRHIVSCNRRLEEIFQYDPGELIGESSARLYDSAETFDHIGEQAYTTIAEGKNYSAEVRLRHKDGSLFWGVLSGRAVDPAQPHDGSIWIYGDITERKLADLALHQSEEKFSTAFSSCPIAASIAMAEDGRFIEANENYERDFGWPRAELIGRTSVEVGIWPDQATRKAWVDALQLEGRVVDYETVWMHKNGQRRNVSLSAELTELGGKPCILAYGTDITARKRAEEKINELAFFDQLTGLPNRTLLLDRLKQTMTASSRSGNHGALLLIDLDKFKTLNDTLGHDMGDRLLQQVAPRLTACVRAGDTVARLGGDEFVVMFTGLSTNARDAATQTEAVGEKILAALRQIYQLKDVAYHSTPSIGATLFSGLQTEIEALLKQADLAMYKAKDAGRNALRFFDPDMESVVMKRAALESGLRAAIKEGQFLLHYQAQVAGGRLIGAEALVRWQHPQRGMVSPAEFIPLAEETGLILPLGQWVLETACKQLVAWAARPGMAHLTVAVNVSAHQFRQPDFVNQVLAVLKNTGVNPQRLKLELTESLLVHDVEEIIEKMFALKARGVGFSLDDFGTGYSSLSYLKRLPLDQLKIDQSFVRDVLSDPNDAAIARTIIALAQSLGLGVIAEGVETEVQRDFLASSGCHAYQGYFFSRPLPVEGFEQYAKQM